MAEAEPCHYKVLEISRHASFDEIKKAFKSQALKFHPDKNPDGESMFKKVNSAYAILSSKAERRKYDAELDRSARGSSLSRRSGGNKWRSPSPASRGNSSAATREFVNNLMKEEREKAERMRASGGFAAWYRDRQADVAAEQSAHERLKAELRQRAETAAHESAMRKERLHDIQVELERNKAEEREALHRE
eukprot:RCo041054